MHTLPVVSRPSLASCKVIRRSLSTPTPRCACPTFRTVVRSQTENKPSPEAAPTTSNSREDDVPLWVKREQQRKLQQEMGQAGADLPFPLYLVLSLFTSIASIGSMFEYLNHNAIFGVISPDSPAWAPILGLFALTGLPTAGFFFFKGVSGANAAAEMQDKLDGYMD